MGKRIILIIIAACLIWIAVCCTLMFTINSASFKDLYSTTEQQKTLSALCSINYNELSNLPEISKAEWKRKVNKTIGYSFYFETNARLLIPDDCQGWCYGPILNAIAIDGELQGVDYAAMLLNELVHLVYWTFNSECQTEFIAFKLAFESPDPYMQFVAYSIMNDRLYTQDEYTCTGRIIDYLKIEAA